MRVSTSFVVAAGVAASSLFSAAASAQVNSPGDIQGMVLQYQGFFFQTSTTPPVSTSSYAMTPFISLDPSVDDVDFIEVIKPNSSSVSFSGSGTFYTAGQLQYGSQAALMSAWPNGTYTYSITDFDENVWNYTLSQPSVAGGWPTVIPAFTPASYTALQGMDPTQSITLNVNAFVPGGATPATNGQLSGLSINQRFGTLLGPTAYSSLTTVGSPTSSRTVPANTLLPNTDYYASWSFDQRYFTSFPPPSVVEGTNVAFGHITRVAFTTGSGVPACVADVDDGSGTGTPDGGVTIDDLLYYLSIFNLGDVAADVDDGSGTGTPDAGVTIDDLLYFLTRFNAGC
ncbi:MAG: GC-type dockerin domain-anchored protein [Phycisphaerales bacterium]